MATGNEELEEFKTQINLCEYASSQGFVLDRKESSRSSAVMRHPNGDKIIVAKRPNGHWTYFNVRGSDSGSIIDFVSVRSTLSLGGVRKELRPWVGKTASISVANDSFDLKPTEGDLQKVRRRWQQAKPLTAKDTYLSSRQIPLSILEDPIFRDRIRIDQRKNCIFPHFDPAGELSGFEIKSKTFTGFPPGGKKWFWSSRPRATDQIAVVCESAVDALSFATIHGIHSKRFFSTAGTCGPQHARAFAELVAAMPAVSSIWLAFDNDRAGHEMANKLRVQLETELKDAILIVDRFPEVAGADWNDMLVPTSENLSHQKRIPG
jgi:hypothetical protein